MAGGSLKTLLEYASTPQLTILERPLDETIPRAIAYRTGIEVITQAPEKVPYLMEPLISVGSINMIAGNSGTYKTWHMLSMMLDLAFGYGWNGHPGTKTPGEPITTVYVNKEMSGGMLDVRLRQLAKEKKYSDREDFEEIMANHIIVVEEAEVDLKNDTQRDRLEQLVVDVEASLIILDSFSMCWTGDENSASEVAQFYVQMREITERTGVTWALVHHLVKPERNRKERASKFSVRGSGQIIQQADAALLFETVPHDEPNQPPMIAVTHAKTRTVAEMPTWVTKFSDNDGLFTSIIYDGLLADKKASAFIASRGDPAKFAAWVTEAVSAMPVMHPPMPGLRSTQLFTLLQTSWPDKEVRAPSTSTIRRHVEQMIANGEIEVLDENKKLGNLYRMANIPLISAESEKPETDPTEE